MWLFLYVYTADALAPLFTGPCGPSRRGDDRFIVEPPHRCEFVQNSALEGRSVAREIIQRRCTDVIAHHIGPGAYAEMTSAGIRVWAGTRARPAASSRSGSRRRS